MRPTERKLAAGKLKKFDCLSSAHAEWNNQSNGKWQKTAYRLQNEKTVIIMHYCNAGPQSRASDSS